MPKPDKRIEEAFQLFKRGLKLVEIAKQLKIPEGTVRRWKHTYKWEVERSGQKSERSPKRKVGGQIGNKNAVGNHGGAPKGNQNALKHGFFSRYLPEDVNAILSEIEQKDPLDILWENIQISYAAIIRSQMIMYVKDKKDKTIEKIETKDGSIIGEKWEIQQAWDKQASFLTAQAKAQGELRSLIKQYEELVHKNWEKATEEQKLRVDIMKAKIEKEEEKEIKLTLKKASDIFDK